MSVKEKLLMHKDQLVESYLGGASTCELGRRMGCSPASVFVFLRSCGVPMRQVKVVDRILEKVKELHEQGLSAYAITKELGLKKNAAERALAKLGVDISVGQRKRNDPLKNHEEEIVSLYTSGTGTSLIAKKFVTKDASIVRFLKKRGVVLRPLRKYPVDESFFDRIDTQEKAYILGFWYADGCNESNVPVVSMRITDKDILLSMAAAMHFDGPVEVYRPKKSGRLLQYGIRIGSRRLSDALTKVGCMSGKTYLATFPTNDMVPDRLLSHFVRGLSDGDGTITTKGSRAPRLWHSRIVGTLAICQGIKDALRRLIGSTSSVCPVHVGPSHTIHGFTVAGRKALRTYLDWLYADATICLERKRAKYLEFLAACQREHAEAV